jgi:hypothetical protein
VKIYLICSVRNADEISKNRSEDYVKKLESRGHSVHYPPRDVSQDDASGAAICASHFFAMQCSDEVHVIWDVESKGSHFDLGMAFALKKNVYGVESIHPDTEGKSYWKVIKWIPKGWATSCESSLD